MAKQRRFPLSKGEYIYLSYLLYSVSIGVKTVASNPSNKEINERIETNKSNKFNSSGENRHTREEEEASKARKAEKLTQTVRAVMIKQRVENTCRIGRQRNREGEKCTITTQQQLYHVRQPQNRRLVAKQLPIC